MKNHTQKTNNSHYCKEMPRACTHTHTHTHTHIHTPHTHMFTNVTMLNYVHQRRLLCTSDLNLVWCKGLCLMPHVPHHDGELFVHSLCIAKVLGCEGHVICVTHAPPDRTYCTFGEVVSQRYHASQALESRIHVASVAQVYKTAREVISVMRPLCLLVIRFPNIDTSLVYMILLAQTLLASCC